MLKVNYKFLFLFGCAITFTLLTNTPLSYTFGYIFIGILIISILISLKVYNDLACDFILNTKDYTVDSEFNVVMEIFNLKLFPILNLKIRNVDINKISKEDIHDNVVLMPSEILNLPVKVIAKKRGIYPLNNTEFSFSDVFDIFTMKKIIPTKKSIKIYPRIYTLSSVSSRSNNVIDTIAENLYGKKDSSNIKDIRKYVNGDSLKNIHWKLSAKSDTFMVKNYSSIVGKEVNILVNMHSHLIDSPSEEKMISFLASLSKYFCDRGIKNRVFLNNFDKQVYAINSKEEFNTFYESLVTTICDGKYDFSTFLLNNVKKSFNNSLNIILDIEVSKETINSILGLKRLRHDIWFITDSVSNVYNEDITHLNNLDVILGKFDDYIIS